MKRLWTLVAGICMIAAAFLLVRGKLDAAFVIAVIGVVAWFLSYRVQMKEITAAADLERSVREDEDSDDV